MIDLGNAKTEIGRFWQWRSPRLESTATAAGAWLSKQPKSTLGFLEKVRQGPLTPEANAKVNLRRSLKSIDARQRAATSSILPVQGVQDPARAEALCAH